MPRVRMRVDETKTNSLRRSCGDFRAGVTQRRSVATAERLASDAEGGHC